MNGSGWFGAAHAEALIIAFSLLLYAGFEVYQRTLGANLSDARTVHAEIRRRWVESVVGHPGSEILIIQTLRNSVMAASFMASTAVLALMAMLSLTSLGRLRAGLLDAAEGGLTLTTLLADLKIFLLASCFFVSFILLAMSVRFFNHAGYLMTGAAKSEDLAARKAMSSAYLNRAGSLYSLGLRVFFACVPLIAALLSSAIMLPATIILILVLHYFDRLPKVQFPPPAL